MKKHSPLLSCLASWAALLAAGCSHIEITREGDPHRTVAGTVEYRSEIQLPEDAVVVVRVVDMAGTEQARAAASKDLPLGGRAKTEPVPAVLGEQTITGAKGGSIPFSIDFEADDSLLRHGVNIDARISYGGKVRFRTVSGHVLTLGNVEQTHAVWVEVSGR